MSFLKKNLPFLLAIILISVIISFISPIMAIGVLMLGIIIYFSIKNPLNGILFLAAYLPFEPFVLKFIPENFYTYVRFSSDGLILFLVLYLIFQYIIGVRKFKYKIPFNSHSEPCPKSDRGVISKFHFDLIIILFIIVGFISIIYNQVDWYVGLLSLRQLLRYVLVFYLLIYIGVDKKFIKKFLIIVFAVFLIQSAIGLSQLILPASFSQFLTPDTSQISLGNVSVETGSIGWDPSQRISGTFGRYDKLGIFLSFFLVLAVGLYYKIVELCETTRKFVWKKLALQIVFLFGILALIFTFSRLSWLGFLLGLIWIGMVIMKDKKIKLAVGVAMIILILYLLSYLIFTGFTLRTYEEVPATLNLSKRILQTFSLYEIQNSYYGYGRIFFWINTPLQVVKYSPLIGVGPGQYGSGVAAALNQKQVYDQLGLPFGIQDRFGQIDNNWLSIWGEYGTLGLILWLSLFMIMYKNVKKVYLKTNDKLIKGLTLGFLGVLIIYPIQNLFGPYFEVRTISFYFWTIAGCLSVLKV